MNPLLLTDVYKMSHMRCYAPGTTKVYSYLQARSNKCFNKMVFFGLQYYLKKYLLYPLKPHMADEFISVSEAILGECPPDVQEKVHALCNLGYWPVEVRAVEEGTVLPVKNVLMTITNTHPDFYWCVGFIESLLLKIWYTCTVATHSYHYREAIEQYFEWTVDDDQRFLIPFMVHDFGYRGDSSEEGAAISGVAHLCNFTGSDTVPAYNCARGYYYGGLTQDPIMASVPASEHSVMCSFGKEDELAAFENMLDKYPIGIVSIVSDTFDVYRVLTEFAGKLKDRILARNGKVVFRPDSGNPEHIICGDPDAEEGSNEQKGAIRLLDEMFGSTINSKGYKVLNEKVGLIYGDGMYLERYKRTLDRMLDMGYAASNLVIGVGGILRNHSRDTLGFAIKATYVEVNGESRDIEKDPVTDKGKKSHKGLLALRRFGSEFKTIDQVHPNNYPLGYDILQVVYRDGELGETTETLLSIRDRINTSIKESFYRANVLEKCPQ